jgi:hypothetical protein
MEKIPTIFDRNWEGNRGVIEHYVIDPAKFEGAMATEKLDGTNVRLTVRNHILVRLEKRRNPNQRQKVQGITEPWYVDADEYEPSDKILWDAAHHTDLSMVPDGEWSGEAVGPKIQGNPLHLEQHTVVLFSLPAVREMLKFEHVPTTCEELKRWLPEQESKFGNHCKIEGIVWHCPDGSMMKIKTRDFK